MLSLVLVACGQSTDDTPGVDSCTELGDVLVTSYQDAIDAVEDADPDLPDGVDEGEDQQRVYDIVHIMGGLDWIEGNTDMGVRWDELGCEPQDMNSVVHDRMDELSYETPAGEYLVEIYFGL
ncbi:MAG: hypothetical protein U9N79_09525 [Actinomycetota bacterium]|nr:hypothetical protein [Actinomycetota bacterium]